jgi:polysaccharide biosynthesis/export protein
MRKFEMTERLAMVLAVCVLAIRAMAQEPANPDHPAAPPRTEASASNQASPTYKIGPQDLLRIDVWKEPDISRTIPVRPDGKISLPLLNDVQAAGLTAMELAGVIREGLTKYITSPQVTVTVTEINSRRVYCTGEVLKPGALSLLPNMTALQAISSCGGFTQFAKIKGIYILRVENGKQVQHPFNYKDVVKGKKPEDNILLQSGDVIVVP